VRRRRLPGNPALTDGVVTLRRWSPDDVAALTEAWQDPELQRRFGVDPPVTTEACAAYVEGVAARWDDRRQVSLAIVAGGDLVGGCDLDHLDTEHPDLGYWLAAGARGHGYATRGARLLLDWAGSELAITDVCIEVELDNAASIAIAARLGFAPAPGVERTDGARRFARYERHAPHD
jgi:RimJ/RimL family protein N-acetyltransferase